MDIQNSNRAGKGAWTLLKVLLFVGFLLVVAGFAVVKIGSNNLLSEKRIDSVKSKPPALNSGDPDEQTAAESELDDTKQEAVIRDLTAKGEEPFSRNAKFWNELLRDERKPGAVRAAGAEALAMSTPDAMPLLRDVAIGAEDADVRAMAAWSLSVLGQAAPFGRELAARIPVEDNPDVRRRLYEALLVQKENPAGELLEEIASEPDLAAQVAGYNAFGDAVARSGEAGLSASFDQQAVPELEAIASAEIPLNLRLRAVFALRRASTPVSVNALMRLSKSTPNQVASAASNGIQY